MFFVLTTAPKPFLYRCLVLPLAHPCSQRSQTFLHWLSLRASRPSRRCSSSPSWLPPDGAFGGVLTLSSNESSAPSPTPAFISPTSANASGTSFGKFSARLRSSGNVLSPAWPTPSSSGPFAPSHSSRSTTALPDSALAFSRRAAHLAGSTTTSPPYSLSLAPSLSSPFSSAAFSSAPSG